METLDWLLLHKHELEQETTEWETMDFPQALTASNFDAPGFVSGSENRRKFTQWIPMIQC